MIDISSSTAMNDQSSFSAGGNAGVTFGPKMNTTTLLIAAAVVVAFLVLRKG